MTKAGSKLSRTIKMMVKILVLMMLVTTMASAGIGDPGRVVVIISDAGVIEVSTDRTVVADVLAEAGLEINPRHQKTYPELDDELNLDYIVIKEAAQVQIIADGQELTALTWAETVEELLAENSITAEGDIVNLPLDAKPETGLRVEIIRVLKELVSVKVPIAAGITYKNDSSLTIGKENIQTQAKNGIKELTYEVTYNDGVEVSRSLVADKVLTQPVTGVILRGTQPVVSRSPSNGAVEGVASYYGAELHGRKTASGVPFDMNALTAAHLTLPFGTRVKVTYLATGRSVIVVINDRGPHIAGRIIDLSAAAAKEIGLYADGIGKVRLEILN